MTIQRWWVEQNITESHAARAASHFSDVQKEDAMTHTDGFYPDCLHLRTEPLVVDHRRYVLDDADFEICGAELLDENDHDHDLYALLAVLNRGEVGVYGGGAEAETRIERVW